MTMKNGVFWDVTPAILVNIPTFHKNLIPASSTILTIEAAGSSERSVRAKYTALSHNTQLSIKKNESSMCTKLLYYAFISQVHRHLHKEGGFHTVAWSTRLDLPIRLAECNTGGSKYRSELRWRLRKCVHTRTPQEIQTNAHQSRVGCRLHLWWKGRIKSVLIFIKRGQTENRQVREKQVGRSNSGGSLFS